MGKKPLTQKTPLREGVLKNNQIKPDANIKKEAVLSPPPAKPKKKD